MKAAGVFLVVVGLANQICAGLDLAPPSFREKPRWPDRNYYDEDGPSIELNCKITNVSYKLIWMKNGHPIDTLKDQYPFHKQRIITRGGPMLKRVDRCFKRVFDVDRLQYGEMEDGNQSLIFEDPKQFQSGLYRCLAYNAAGNISHSGDILITARKEETRPKVVETQPVNTIKHAKIGDTVNISCTFDVGGSVEALMNLAVAWIRSNETVNDTSHTSYGLNITADNNKISSLNIDKLQFSDYGTYMCFGENWKGNDSRLISVVPPEDKQKTFPFTLVIGCGSAGVVSITMLIVVAVLRHRYKLKQKYEDLEWLMPDSDQYEVPNKEIEYDVFISYSSEDLDWVKDVLFYELCEQGYSVCTDFKDFTPGVAVAENIMDAVYKSHKTIVVMSKHFLKSMWGQFELQQAHNRAVMQRSDVLILIKLDDSKVPGKLMGKTFLDWSDAKIHPHFWTRLFEAIGKPAKFEDTHGINREKDCENKENPDETTTVENETLRNTRIDNNDEENYLQNNYDNEINEAFVGKLICLSDENIGPEDCDNVDETVRENEGIGEKVTADT